MPSFARQPVTSAALASCCRCRRHPLGRAALPKGKVSTPQLIQPIASGALVLALDTDFDGCMQIVRRHHRGSDALSRQLDERLRMEGQKTVAFEIVQQFDWQVPDWIVIPVGNLGNVSALGKGF